MATTFLTHKRYCEDEIVIGKALGKVPHIDADIEFLAAVILCIILRRNGEVGRQSLLGCGGENWGSWSCNTRTGETEGS